MTLMAEKTQESGIEAKREAQIQACEENPDAFVAIEALVFGAIQSETGEIAVTFNPNAKRSVLHTVRSECFHAIELELTKRDVEAAKKQATTGIQVPGKGGIMNFARKLRRH